MGTAEELRNTNGFETVKLLCLHLICLFICLSVPRLLLACFLYLHLSLLYSQSFMLLLFSLLRRRCYVSTTTSPPAGESRRLFPSPKRPDQLGSPPIPYSVDTRDVFVGMKAAVACSLPQYSPNGSVKNAVQLPAVLINCRKCELLAVGCMGFVVDQLALRNVDLRH